MRTEGVWWSNLTRAFSFSLVGATARYAAALGIFLLATGLRFAISPWQTGVPFLTYFPAVTFAALLCGVGPSLMALVLSDLTANFFFMEPVGTFTVTREAIISMIVFALSGLLIVLIVGKYRRDDAERTFQANLVTSADVAIMSKTLQGIITSWNPEAERLFGYSATEAIGKPMTITFPPDRLGEEAEFLARIANGERITRYETERLRRDGTVIDVSVTLSPLRDRRGRIVGAVKIAHDITARKALEVGLQRANRQLIVALEELRSRNRELDEFAYIASHDLKEPLRGIHNYVSFLFEDHADRLDDEGRGHLDRMKRLAERMSTLIDCLLAYSRMGNIPLPMERFELDTVLDEVAKDLQPFLDNQGVELRRVCRLPAVFGNVTRIGEVLQNLVVNAAKYNDKAEKWVEVGCEGKEGKTVFFVRDNGIGIPEIHLENIFRIFKRLHEQSKYGGGAGAGLTIVKKIIERHGGRIWVESIVGVGSTFYFTLTEDPK